MVNWKCNKCNHEWDGNEDVEKCPNCGEDLYEKQHVLKQQCPKCGRDYDKNRDLNDWKCPDCGTKVEWVKARA